MVEQKPVQPQAVAKELSTNSMLSSAMLSEMSEKGLLKVSSLKVGSSPLYYHPDHPEHLLNYLHALNEKDRKTFAILQDKGVLRDQELEPLLRVSLRNIKDFAKPLDVTIDGNKELFWKFYLLTDEQSAEKIKLSLQPAQKPVSETKPRKPRVKKAKIVTEQPLASAEPQVSTALQPENQVSVTAIKTEIPTSTITEPITAAQTEEKPPAEASMSITDDPFLQQLLAFFATNNIKVLEQLVLKKKSEYDFVLQLTSPVGQLHYYAKAKNKAKIGEADLSHAYVHGQLKKLPVLFLAPGQLTKPATELLKELKGLTVKQV